VAKGTSLGSTAHGDGFRHPWRQITQAVIGRNGWGGNVDGTQGDYGDGGGLGITGTGGTNR